MGCFLPGGHALSICPSYNQSKRWPICNYLLYCEIIITHASSLFPNPLTYLFLLSIRLMAYFSIIVAAYNVYVYTYIFLNKQIQPIQSV